MTYISVDRRIDIMRKPVRYVLVHREDVPATLALLRRHGILARAEPAGGYAFPGAHRVVFDRPPLETALRLIAAGGAGAITHIEALGVDLDDVVVQMRQQVLSGSVETVLHVHGECVWPLEALSVAS